MRIYEPLLYLVIVCSLLNGGCKDSKSHEDQKDLIKKKLAIGTSFENVESYLKETDIEYSFDEDAKIFTCIKRNVNKNGFTTESISIKIFMDNENKIKETEVKSVFTGP